LNNSKKLVPRELLNLEKLWIPFKCNAWTYVPHETYQLTLVCQNQEPYNFKLKASGKITFTETVRVMDHKY